MNVFPVHTNEFKDICYNILGTWAKYCMFLRNLS